MIKNLEEELENLEDYTNDLHERYNEKKAELDKVKRQLAVAVEALKDIYEWADDEFKATDMSKEALEQIEELDK